LTDLRRGFANLPAILAAKHTAAALGRSIDPALSALRQLTPKGPTGNLRKAIRKKIKRYKNGNAVALIGYQIGDEAKGYHQGFLEFGTKDRRTKGRYASSFRKPAALAVQRGGFRVVVTKQGKNKGQMRTVSPNHPKSFFKSAKAGETVSLGRMPVGGRLGRPPVKTAWEQSRNEVAINLQLQLGAALENACAEMAGRLKRGISVSAPTS
jgi:hypothetical protein